MSYDVWLNSNTCCHGHNRNHTSNTARMWRTAGIDLAECDGKRAGDMVVHLRAAVAEMDANPGTYRAMNPENGWGDFESCREFLGELLADWQLHPDATIAVSR